MLRKIRKALHRQDWLAFIIEFFIVILGIVIAYQINIYRQAKETEQQLGNLKQALALENQQNKKLISSIRYDSQLYPENLRTLVQLIENNAPLDSINLFAPTVLQVQYLNINKSYLNYFLESVDKTKPDKLIENLIKLQNLYQDLQFMSRELVIPYRIELLSQDLISQINLIDFSFTAFQAEKKQQIINQLRLLELMESENLRVTNNTYQQIQLVDSLLTTGGVQIPVDSTSN